MIYLQRSDDGGRIRKWDYQPFDGGEVYLAGREVDRRLLADVQAVRAHHAFTRDRVGQPGCQVRRIAAEHVEALDRVVARLIAGSLMADARLSAADTQDDASA